MEDRSFSGCRDVMSITKTESWRWLDEGKWKLYPINAPMVMCAPICGNGNNLDAVWGHSVKLMCPMCQAIEGFVW